MVAGLLEDIVSRKKTPENHVFLGENWLLNLAFFSMNATLSISPSWQAEKASWLAVRKLYEMNKVISDTAEYGCWDLSHCSSSLHILSVEW